MIGFTCGEHLATRIADREPILCRRWVPGFARACIDCGASSYRGDPLVLLYRVLGGKGSRGGDIEKTVRRMREASEGFRARKRRERTGA